MTAVSHAPRSGRHLGHRRNDDMRRPADADLFRAWRDERSSVALDRLIDRLWAPTVRASFAVAHDLGDAEDSAQEAFLHLARRAEELRDPDAVQGWLRSIAVNHARHRVRARLRRKRNEAGAAQRRASALAAPEELVSRRLDAECVLPLLERLPEAQRTALRLHFVAGLTQREVASSMGSSAGTAASRIRLGLERLRRELVAVGPTLSVAALAALLAQGESRAAAIAQAARPPVASSLIVQAGGVRRSSPLFTMLCVCAGGLALLIALLIWFSQAEEPVGVARPEAGVVLATASGRAAETEDARSAPPGSSRSQEPTPSAPPVALAEPATSPNPVAGHAAIERSWFAGRVVDARTLEPIAHAKLYVSRELPWGFEEECPERAVTDAAGRFDVPWDTTPSEASTSRVQVAVCVSGYQPFVGALRLAPGGADAELRLEPHVSSDLQGRIALVDESEAALPPGILLRVFWEPQRASGFVHGSAQRLPFPEHGTIFLTQVRADDRGRFSIAGLPEGVVWAEVADQQGFFTPLRAAPELRWVGRGDVELTVPVARASSLLIEVPALGEDEWAMLVVDGQPDPIQLKGPQTRVTEVPAGRVRLGVSFVDEGDTDLALLKRALLLPDVITEVVTVPGEEARVRLEVKPPASRRALVCNVRYPNGSPAPSVQVWIARDGSGWIMEERAATDGAGQAVLPGLTEGRYRVWSPGTEAEVKVSIAGGSPDPIQLTIPERVPVRGRLIDPHGVPVAGARIVGQWLPDFLGEELAHEAETGPGGAFELAPIPPGVATFVIEAAGRRQYRVQRTVAGEPLSLQLPLADAPFTVRGTVSRACADGTLVQVTLSGEGFERHGLSGTLAGSFAIELEGVELTGPATLTLHLGTTGGEERRAVEPYVDQIYLDGLFAE